MKRFGDVDANFTNQVSLANGQCSHKELPLAAETHDLGDLEGKMQRPVLHPESYGNFATRTLGHPTR